MTGRQGLRGLRGGLQSGLVLLVGGLCMVAGVQAQTSVVTRTSSFEYRTDGLLTKEVVEPDLAQDCLTTSYGYDVYGNKTSATAQTCTGASGYTVSSAGAARTSSTTYGAQVVVVDGVSYTSAAGIFATSISNALAHSETREYDPRFGAVIKLVGPNGGVTTWSYDGFGRKLEEKRADGTRTKWEYQFCGVAQSDGAAAPCSAGATLGGHSTVWYVSEGNYDTAGALLGSKKLQVHDSLDRVVRVQTLGFDGSSVVQDSRYNALGQLSQRSNQYQLTAKDPAWTYFSYDAMGRITKEDAPDVDISGGRAVTEYSYSGLITTVKNAAGQTKTTHKNANGQTAKVVDHLGSTVVYTYDALGQLTQTNAQGVITTMGYSQRGHKLWMEDPAMGHWDYKYNAFGELVEQKDSLSQTSSYAYDKLGRMTQRSEPDLVSSWSYDKKFDGNSCAVSTSISSIGKLCEAKTTNGYQRVHVYDGFGRPSSTSTKLDSGSSLASMSQSFDAVTGRLKSQTWPTGYVAGYEYNSNGYLKKVTGGGVTGHLQTVSLEVLAMNPQGQITQYKQGNNVTTVKTIDASTGKLKGVQATLSGQTAGNVLNQTFGYDALGNLKSRADGGTGVSESFQYDTLNRLSLYTAVGGALGAVQTTQALYDEAGNLRYKSDVGYYQYDSAVPNRLTGITQAAGSNWRALGTVTQANTGTRALTYAFDDQRSAARTLTDGTKVGNGNLWYTVSQDSSTGRHTVRWETYTSYNMPQQILFGNLVNPADPTAAVADRTLTYVYGPEHQRVRQDVQLTSNAPSHMEAGTTWYYNGSDSQGLSYEKEVKANGTIEHKHYVNAAGIVFALYVKREGTLNGKPATSISYFHHDHLGSIAAISNELGQRTEQLAYDPWGKRRYTNGTVDKLDAVYGVNTERGYTMHEHLDEVGVIHMNGRIYDPLIGRFMSADPHIQAPGNLQSYNRYAYVLNNPLAYTDPSGYFSLRGLFKIGIAIFQTPIAVLPQREATILYSVASAKCGPLSWVCAAASQAAIAYYHGASLEDAAKVGAKSGATAWLFYQAGDIYQQNHGWGYAAHAGVGCVTSVADGGKCGPGAASAVFGKYTSVGIEGMTSNQFAAGLATAVAGGVGSVIAGGKFENGAKTAAYGYLFNQLAHSSRSTPEERLKAALAQLAPEDIPPGVDVNANIERSQSMTGREYYDAVKTGGEWDYKQLDRKYENFGNFNFGATCGSQAGANLICSGGAGLYQIKSGTSDLSYWKSFFDDPRDQYWIGRGQQYYNRYQSEYMWWAQPVRPRKRR